MKVTVTKTTSVNEDIDIKIPSFWKEGSFYFSKIIDDSNQIRVDNYGDDDFSEKLSQIGFHRISTMNFDKLVEISEEEYKAAFEKVNNKLKLVSDLRAENYKFREDVKLLVDNINTKTDKKHTPIMLEQDILRTAQLAINESIQKALTEYNSPLKKLTEAVILENTTFLKQLISDCFNSVIKTEDFKTSIINAFSHKVARSIISNNDGLFERVSNELKQDAIFKSKMSLAVSNVVEECLKERSK